MHRLPVCDDVAAIWEDGASLPYLYEAWPAFHVPPHLSLLDLHQLVSVDAGVLKEVQADPLKLLEGRKHIYGALFTIDGSEKDNKIRFGDCSYSLIRQGWRINLFDTYLCFENSKNII